MKKNKIIIGIIILVVIFILFVPFFKIAVSGCGTPNVVVKKFSLATILLYGGELGCGMRDLIY